jgi:hypothetical protein
MRRTGWVLVFTVVLALVPATAAASGGDRRLEQRMEEWFGAHEGGLTALRNQAFGLDGRVSDLGVQVGRGQAVDEELASRLDQAETHLLALDRRITDLASRRGWPFRPLHWVVLGSGWLAALAVASLFARGAVRARRPPPTWEEHSVNLGKLTGESAPPVSAGDWWPRTALAPSITAASRRAMSLADIGWKRHDA